MNLNKKIFDHAIRIGTEEKIISINKDTMSFSRQFTTILESNITRKLKRNEKFPFRASVVSAVNSWCPTRREEEKTILYSFVVTSLDLIPFYRRLSQSESEGTVFDRQGPPTKTALDLAEGLVDTIDSIQDMK